MCCGSTGNTVKMDYKEVYISQSEILKINFKINQKGNRIEFKFDFMRVQG